MFGFIKITLLLLLLAEIITTELWCDIMVSTCIQWLHTITSVFDIDERLNVYTGKEYTVIIELDLRLFFLHR